MVSIRFKILLISVAFLPLCYSRAVSNQEISNIINHLNNFESDILDDLSNLESEVVSNEIVRPALTRINTDENLAINNETIRNSDEKMNLRQRELMDHILKSLNLSGPPVISEEDKIPYDFPLIRNIRRLNSETPEDHSGHGETTSQKLISVARKSPFLHRNTEGSFFFNLTSENRPSLSIKTAVLNYYIAPRNYSVEYITLHYDVIRPRHFNHHHSVGLKQINVSVADIIKNQGWMTLTFSAFVGNVQGWLEKPDRNLGIRFLSSNVPNAIATTNGKKPYLEIEFHRRSKRNAENLNYCDANSSRNDCCLNRFTINFHDVGWDWIIYPLSYEANYCAGHCSPIQHDQSVHKSLVQSQADVAHINPIPKTCCVPMEYEAISLLYYDQQSNIIYSSIPDMKILRCGCA